jgi:hypothetical protein
LSRTQLSDGLCPAVASTRGAWDKCYPREAGSSTLFITLAHDAGGACGHGNLVCLHVCVLPCAFLRPCTKWWIKSWVSADLVRAMFNKCLAWARICMSVRTWSSCCQEGSCQQTEQVLIRDSSSEPPLPPELTPDVHTLWP